MFIVRHFLPAGDNLPEIENLYSAERITHHPVPGNLGALELRTGDTLVAALWGGRVYVMNPNGSTVARYVLPPDPKT